MSGPLHRRDWIRVLALAVVLAVSGNLRADEPNLVEDVGKTAGRGLRKPSTPVAVRRSATPTTSRHWTAWLADPRSSVLFVLVVVIGGGGGRKLWIARKARALVDRLNLPEVRTADLELAPQFGREAVTDLFRLQQTGKTAEIRNAAGHALAVLWAKDDLIAEEEKALVRRGFEATFKARRRYPRDLRVPIPVHVRYGVPFLSEDGPGILAENLEWSHRLVGAQRAALESFSKWHAGPGHVSFEIDPRDFVGNGPHRLSLETRVCTKGLSDSWQIDLPHIPFQFEFDPILEVNALLALADDTRGSLLQSKIRLLAPESEEGSGEVRHLPLNDELVLRDPPELHVASPLPCDLAHDLYLEIEGVPGRFRAGQLVVTGQGLLPTGSEHGLSSFQPFGPIEPVPAGAVEGVGERPIRLILESNPSLGWTDPDIRSVWPGTLITNWHPTRLIRR